MQKKRYALFAVLFLLLAGFSLVSIGAVNSNTELVKAVVAVKEGKPAAKVVQVQEEAFDSKVLRFLKQDKVCALTQSQVDTLADSYLIETKTFDVNGETIEVSYVNGNPLNKAIVEDILGASLDNCQVVHGNKVIAVVSPIFVS